MRNDSYQCRFYNSQQNDKLIKFDSDKCVRQTRCLQIYVNVSD